MRRLCTFLVKYSTVVALCSLSLAEAAEKKKILFLAGKPSHASGDHEFRAGCMLLADKLNKSGLDLEAKVHFYGWPEDETIFNDVDACIIYADGGGRFGEKYAVLNKKVKEDGMGIMFMHYGVHPKKAVGEKYFKPWIGAYMDDHISVNPHWIADLSAVAKEEVARGITPFTAFDEFYFNMQWPVGDEGKDVRPLAVATPTPDRIVRYINMWNKHGEKCFGKEQALMWCRDPKEGGRGVGFVGGHYHKNWAIDDFRKLVLNAIVWTARMEVPKDGVSIGKVTEEDLNKNLDKKRKINYIKLPDEAIYKQKPMIQPWFDENGKRHKSKPKADPKSAQKKTTKNLGKAGVQVRTLAESRVLKASDKDRSQKLIADVKGVKTLTIFVDDVDGTSFDWVAVTDVKFIDAEGKEILVDKKHVLATEQQYGKFGINQNVEGGKIKINGKPVEKGFGSHGAASIGISVPKQAVKFSLIVALDDGGALRGAASAKFSVLNDNVSWKPIKSKNPSKKAKGGSGKPSFVNEEGEFEPQKAPELVGVDHFVTPDGSDLEVTLWAQSPMLYNPTNMDIDHKGRIWVAEGVNYRRAAGRRPEGDRIVVLEDTDKDGKADKSHTFVQEKSLECPLGVSVFDNKVFVPQPPNLVVYTDVNRDLKFDPKVDKKEVLLTGFNAAQHDHSLHSVSAGPDGKLYFNNGNCGAIFKDKSGRIFNMNGVYRGGGGRWFTDNNKLGGKKSDDGFVWTSGFTVRMDEDGDNVEIVGHGYRNSYEQSVNSFCDMFQNDNDDFGSCRTSYILEYGSAGFFTKDGQQTWRSVKRPGQPTARAHWRQDDPGTFDAGDVYGLGSPTGNVFYENGALGEKWIGTYLACEPGRNTVFGYKPKPKGAGFSMKRFDFTTSNSARDFVGGDSTKKLSSMEAARSKAVLFRPSDVAVGPDGAIYVVDWYDGRVGGHSTMDMSCSGAIYRIAPKGFKSRIPQLDLKTVEGQIEALKSPAVNTRYLGFKALKAQGDKVFEQVLGVTSDANKFVAARGVWLLAQLGPKGKDKVVSLLDSADPEIRLVAFRALRRTGTNILPYAVRLVDDADVHVRRDVALSLRHYDATQTKDLFVKLVKSCDPTDKNYIEAIGLGAENKEGEIWKYLKQKLDKTGKWSPAFTKVTWRLWTKEAVTDLKKRAMDAGLTEQERQFAVESLAFIDAQEAADAVLDIAAAKSPVKKTAMMWLMKRGTSSWSKFGVRDALKKRGIYDPEKVVNIESKVAEPAKVSKLSVARTMKLKGDVAKGKTKIMQCAMCHKVNGIGPNYGPALKGWGAAQSQEAIIRSIIKPSADIAHGFRGNEITLKDGKVIHGIVLPGDPLIVISTGGASQLVPASRVKKNKRMRRSLMLSAEQLGLTEQDVADITAYMRQWK